MNFQINDLPRSWQLTPVRDKKPYTNCWQNKDLDRDFITQEIVSGGATGYGLRLGLPSGGLLAIDFDGQSAIDYSLEKFGKLPTTVTWTSGRPGRYQALFQVPAAYQERIKNKKNKTGDGEAIEFRYTGNQSVLPPSAHPETDGYKWVNDPIDTPVVELSQVVIDYLLELEPKPRRKVERKIQPVTTPESVQPIPLVNCLVKSNRESLKGVTEPGRNDAGAKLARDLIACANWLDTEGITFEGDPRELFDGFVAGCEPPLGSDDKNEPNIIWQQAEKDNPDPSCNYYDSDGLKNIVDAWNRVNVQVSYTDDIKSLVDKKLKEINSDYPLVNLFHPVVAKSLIEYHQRTAVPQGLLAMALITCLATLIHPESYLECFGGTDRKAKAIFWFTIYGLSGNGKSHSYQPLLKILRDYGTEAAVEHKDLKKDYDALQKRVKRAKPGTLSDDILEEADKPAPERARYVVESATIEALITRAAKQPERGMLMYADELIGWCNRMDPAKGEIEIWLNLKSGNPVDGDRQTREFEYVAAPSISVMGGVQPDVLKKLLVKQDETQNGFVPRLTMVRFNETPTQPIRNAAPINYKDIKALFDRVRSDNTPSTVYLDHRCLDLAEAWRIETDSQRLSESRKSIKALFPKFNELAYSIAFVLHIIKRKLDPTNQAKIPVSTFEAAVGFARWLLSQSISIHEELLESDQKESFITHFIKSSQHRGWMNARTIGRTYGKKRFKDTESVNVFMSNLIQMDLVESRGTGKKLEISCPSVFPKAVDKLTKLAQPYDETNFSVSTGLVDTVDKISSTDPLSTVSAVDKSVDKIGQIENPKIGDLDRSGVDIFSTDLSTKLSTAENGSPNTSQPALSTVSTKPVDTQIPCTEPVLNGFVNLSTETGKLDGQNLSTDLSAEPQPANEDDF